MGLVDDYTKRFYGSSSPAFRMVDVGEREDFFRDLNTESELLNFIISKYKFNEKNVCVHRDMFKDEYGRVSERGLLLKLFPGQVSTQDVFGESSKILCTYIYDPSVPTQSFLLLEFRVLSTPNGGAFELLPSQNYFNGEFPRKNYRFVSTIAKQARIRNLRPFQIHRTSVSMSNPLHVENLYR